MYIYVYNNLSNNPSMFQESYQNVIVDSNMSTEKEFHQEFYKKCKFPSYYGMNLAAFIDSFTEESFDYHFGSDKGINLIMSNFDDFFNENETLRRELFMIIIDCFFYLNNDVFIGGSFDRFSLDCKLGIVTQKQDTINFIKKLVFELNSNDIKNPNIRFQSIEDSYGFKDDYPIYIQGKELSYREYFSSINKDYLSSKVNYSKIKLVIDD